MSEKEMRALLNELNSRVSEFEDQAPTVLRDCEICVVLVEFGSPSCATVRDQLAAVTEIAGNHSAFLHSIISHLVVVAFGITEDAPVARHKDFIAEVLAKFGLQVKVAYSVGLGHVGLVGGPKRIDFGFIFPAFPKVLAELSSTPEGKAKGVYL